MRNRYFFEIAYNGTSFHGWQKQPKEMSVQEEIEDALIKLNSNNPVVIYGCGRTDTGVHANHFIFHVELQDSFNFSNIIFFKIITIFNICLFIFFDFSYI